MHTRYGATTILEMHFYAINEIIWNNSCIKSGNKTIIYINWLNDGTKYIKDLYDDEENKFYGVAAAS